MTYSTNVCDDPTRTAGPSELLSEQPKRAIDPDADFVFPELELSCEAIIELERFRAEKLAANYAEMQKMLPGVYKQAAAMRRPSPSFDQLFDRIFTEAEAMNGVK